MCLISSVTLLLLNCEGSQRAKRAKFQDPKFFEERKVLLFNEFVEKGGMAKKHKSMDVTELRMQSRLNRELGEAMPTFREMSVDISQNKKIRREEGNGEESNGYVRNNDQINIALEKEEVDKHRHVKIEKDSAKNSKGKRDRAKPVSEEGSNVKRLRSLQRELRQSIVQQKREEGGYIPLKGVR